MDVHRHKVGLRNQYNRVTVRLLMQMLCHRIVTVSHPLIAEKVELTNERGESWASYRTWNEKGQLPNEFYRLSHR